MPKGLAVDSLGVLGEEVPMIVEGEPLKVGDRVFVSGGYDMTPRWLGGREGFSGTIARFIPGQSEELAAVIRTDEPVTANGVTGDMLVMELRWVGATWHSGAVAHIELCDFEPEEKSWQERRQGEWIESHASIRHLDQYAARHVAAADHER